jgi:hypothetical protein
MEGVLKMEAYVLVQTDMSRAPIADALRTIPGVENVEDLSGPYDAIAVANYDPLARPLDAIVEEILNVPRVTRALAAPVVRSFVGASKGEAA